MTQRVQGRDSYMGGIHRDTGERQVTNLGHLGCGQDEVATHRTEPVAHSGVESRTPPNAFLAQTVLPVKRLKCRRDRAQAVAG